MFFYAIGLTLFSVNLMVWLVFHKTFSPQIFVLLAKPITEKLQSLLRLSCCKDVGLSACLSSL